MPTERIEIAGPEGRTLDVWVSGAEDAIPVLAHHGTPGSGLPYEPFVETVLGRGLRWVSYCRPGYGRSARHEGRIVADAAAEAAAILDHLHADRFHTYGVSGGGAPALACAALLPGRVLSAASVAGVAPHGAEGLDWLAGMGAENIEEFGLAENDHEGLVRFIEEFVRRTKGATIEDVVAALGDLVADVDKRVLSGRFGEHLIAGDEIAFAHGIWGWFDDDMTDTRPWGFDPAAIGVPVSIWQGGQDRFVPRAHGEWLASHVPGCRSHFPAADGHLSLSVGSYDRIIDDLLDMASQGV